MSEDPYEVFQRQSVTIRGELDSFLTEIEATVAELSQAGDLNPQQLTAYIDRWNHIRALAFRFQWKVSRALSEYADEYRDGMRRHMAKGLSGREGSMHYEERLAVYETKNLSPYKLMRLLEKLDGELKLFMVFLDRKLRWLEDRRRHVKKQDDDFRYSSSRDFQT